jgi:hypothetical protein
MLFLAQLSINKYKELFCWLITCDDLETSRLRFGVKGGLAKLSLCTSWRHVGGGGERGTSIHFWTRNYLEVRGQHHGPTPLRLGEQPPSPPYPMNRRLNDCRILTLFRKEKYFSSAGNRTPGRLFLGLVIYNNIAVTVSCIGIYL